LNRHRRFHSALHAKLQQANAGGSIRKRRFGMDDGKNEENRKQNADRRNSYSAAPTGAAAPLSGEAHIYRRSTTVLAKGTLVVFGSASGQASWDVAGTRFAYPFERALPAPACPSPARIAHP